MTARFGLRDWRFKHGDSHKENAVPEYRVWAQMKDRCHNEKCKSYFRYGGRGITVCDRWRDSYAAFLADMGRRPSPKHSIDRIDNERGYEPENCRWATSTEQMRNRRGTKLNSEAVKVIRFMDAKGTDPALLARLHGVCEAAIRDVRSCKNWREPGLSRKRLRKDYLTAEAVKVIRFLGRNRTYGLQRRLARVHNVSEQAIHAILIGKTWKKVAL